MNIDVKAGILQVCRKIIPDEIRHRVSHQIKKTQSRLSQTQHHKAFSAKTSESVVIVFLVYKPQLWNSLKSVYHASIQNKRVITYLVISPDNQNGTWCIDDKVLSFFRAEAVEVISGDQDGRIFDLSSLKPDIVFRQTPYDEAYPDEYSMKKIAGYAKTCYIPYGFNLSPDKHLRIEYNHPFTKDLFAVFIDCQSNAVFCENLKGDLYPDLNIIYEGFPRLDLLRELEDRREKDCYTFSWIPRWSLDSVYNDPSGFLVYKDVLLGFFKENPHCKLIIRPHPLMFPNFIKWGVMSEQEVNDFQETIGRFPNVRMDNNFDYLLTFEETDALIADWSSLLYEFYLTGKPIIYCGSTAEHNQETETMMKLLYKVDNWKKMKKRMETLISGQDELEEERREDIQSMLAELPENIGKAIVDRCISFCT